MVLDSELLLDRFQKDGDKYVTDVQKDVVSGVEDLKSFSKQPKAAETLKVIKSKVRNDFFAALDSTGSVAQSFAWYYRFNRDPRVLDMVIQSIDSLTPKDVDAYANKYFIPQGQVITTLWHDPQAASVAPEAKQ
jgi:predicted Zn-dependent peptidase